MKDFYYIYVSGWSEKGGIPGMALYKMDKASGEMEFVKQLNDKISFNGSAIDADHGMLFVNNEVGKLPGRNVSGGRIYAFNIDYETGDLNESYYIDTYSPQPCYVNLFDGGKYLLEAHCNMGGASTGFEKDENGKWQVKFYPDESTVQLYKRDADGKYELIDVKKHVIESPRVINGRIEACHPHSAVASPDGNFVAVCDKGDFCVYLYKLNRDTETLELCSKRYTGGPGRYCAFHPTKPWFYMNHEGAVNEAGKGGTADADMTVCAFSYDENGILTPINTISVKNTEFGEGHHYEQQGFVIHPEGKCLYTQLNAKENAMAIIDVDPETGAISCRGFEPVCGVWPRDCKITPDGRFFITTSMSSGDISVYDVLEDGGLKLKNVLEHKQPGAAYITILDV